MNHVQNVEIVISQAALAARVEALGAQITADYRGLDLVCIGVLKGCLPFIADLIRQIDLPLAIDFLGLSSYGNDTKSSGVVRVTSDLSNPIEGKDVLVVEDIVDTGLTMGYLLENLRTRQPKSVKVCTLLYKPAPGQREVAMDYVGFTVPNKFLIGYGLDHGELYRNLPYVGAITTSE